MEKFLNKLAGELYGKFGEGISAACIVLPSKRAGLYFKRALGELIEKPLWSPEIYSIDEFIEKYSPLTIADDLTLIFELYEVYKLHGEDEPFDEFYPWGEMLLRDLGDVDKYLVDAKRLFAILYEHREIEEDFEFKLTDIEEFSRFWQTFSTKELSDVQSGFIKTWEIMGKVYHEFRKALAQKGLCYQGMAYRNLYEMAKTKKLAEILKKEKRSKVIFAGLNMLSKAEEGIIKELLKQNIAETYWDSDEYYLDNHIQEAGYFLRKNFERLEISKDDVKWSTNELKSSAKNVKILGAPLMVSQAKILGNELKKITEPNETVIVLPDESMLQSVLNSLPENTGKLNISMGFPLKNTPLYSLLRLLKNIQAPPKGDKTSSSFYHKDITRILLHPYVKFTQPDEIYKLVDDIKSRNIIFTSRKKILEAFIKPPQIVSEIFNKVSTANGSIDYIYKILELVSQGMTNDGSKSGSGEHANRIEAEYLFRFYTELNRISSIINKYSTEIEKETFWKLLLEIADTLKIYFTGEPPEGLQIVGLLETRLTDFKNVFILSMNEGIIPRGNTHGSFIPYNLRKGLGMSVHEDDDSNTAYNFYRLLQRAENVTLIYNTEPGELTAGEKSRFVMQIEQELALSNKNVSIENKILQTDVELPARREITIEKSASVLDALKAKKGFSATGLSTYVNCPLQFYFRTVTKLEEEDEVEEFFSGGAFGSILHKIMEILYTPYIGKIADEKSITKMRKLVNDGYDALWEDACASMAEYAEFKTGLKGKNLLYKNIIRKLIDKILEHDTAYAPFKILALEKEVEQKVILDIGGEKITVNLFGILDRIQLKDGVENIVDYKTGYMDTAKVKGKITPENMAQLFEDPKHKEKFQQYFYSTIYLNGEEKLLRAGVYPLQKISEGIIFFEENHIPPETAALYEQKLIELLTKIFDNTTPFTQTKEIERCTYCAYKSLCYRD